ncbi:MAG: helix-turn-helix domain-containing protein [Tannerellaceae bacterium]|jgi:transcriptional regulator with XRE-family HTH domain|nr:helix-turn-helix domain-containing protein [Tannerellaceae bacterium]
MKAKTQKGIEPVFNKSAYREVMGEKLKEFRENRGLSAYRVAKDGGISIGQVNIVESGNTNYTINVFLGYIKGCDLYVQFSGVLREIEKTEKAP